MTRRMLGILGGLRGALWLRATLVAVAAVLVPITVAIDMFLIATHRVREARALRQRSALCERGHVNELVGDFVCPSCGLVGHDLHAWARCHHCGARSYSIACACGLPVVSPLPEELP